MALRYGNYRHREAEANVQIRREPVRNHSQTYCGYVETWSISGRLHNRTGSASGMDAIIKEFVEAYQKQGKDLVLERQDGTSTYHMLRSKDCVGGTRVVQPPEFPDGRRGENVSFRGYSLQVQGIKPLLAGVSAFLDFQESISIKGGGRQFACVEVNRGVGVRQMTRTHAKCVATQSGNATLWTGYPFVPKPIWPYALVDEFPDVTINSLETISDGTARGTALVNGSLSWSYSYEAVSRLWGIPHYLTR